MATGSRFWLTNRVANPVLRRVLRGPAGHRLGRTLAVVRYPGRHSGLPHELVVQYARDGNTVWIVVGGAAGKTWWRNLRTASPVDLWLAGEHHRATAVAVVGSRQPEDAAAGLAAYASAVRGARASDPRTAVLVRAELTAN